MVHVEAHTARKSHVTFDLGPIRKVSEICDKTRTTDLLHSTQDCSELRGFDWVYTRSPAREVVGGCGVKNLRRVRSGRQKGMEKVSGLRERLL